MTDAHAYGAPPAGWLPDPSGAPRLRWWNGHDWTDDFAPLPQAQVSPPRPHLPAGVPLYNVFIWLVVFVPFLTVPLLFLFDPTSFVALEVGTPGQVDAGQYSALLLPILAYGIFGWIVYGAGVVFAYFDWRRLGRDGVVRPFHWAWTFLSTYVYVIGRSVIVYRVSHKRGLAPVWALIGVTVLTMVATIVWLVNFFSELLQVLYDSGLAGYTGV